MIALDTFLTLNHYLLVMSSSEVYQLAKETVTAKLDGRATESVLSSLAAKIEAASVSFETLNEPETQQRLGPQYGELALYVEGIQRSGIIPIFHR